MRPVTHSTALAYPPPPHFDDGDPHLLPFADDDYPPLPVGRSRPLGVWRFLSRVRFLPGA